jgi:uncharacterized protein (DUF1800 family)
MSRTILARCASVALFSAVLLGFAGCGNGSSGSTTPQIAVIVYGASATRIGSSTQFSATVTGTTNGAVLWQVNGVTGGTAATGTISVSGLYTPPAALPSNPSVTITAVSVASSSASSSLIEAIQNPLPVVTSSTATQVGATLSYTVNVVGTGFISGSVIDVNGIACTTTYISATQLQCTATLTAGSSSITVLVSNPAPGAVLSASLNVPVAYIAATTITAARLLDQASFGPTAATIAHVQSVGVNGYLAEQFAVPTTALPAVPTNPLPTLCLANNNPRVCAESEWWQTAVTGPDQLRQRVAFALSEMFVVSSQSISGAAIPQFHNALANDAFGNFATIMHDVALSPAMGGYLNMLNSAKPATGQIANENFARENMQLFSLGLYLLNQDGSQQLDGSGNPIPSYTQAQVQAFARAYTGWTYANATGGSPAAFTGTANFAYPMASVQSQHDTTSKILLNGTVLSAGGTAEADLAGALSNIFNHSNVGPFVCTQLIQHLVTGNPSPAYVSRVAAVFANNGSGVRGDMKAVITAILTDQEARAGDTNADFNGGHLREPALFIANMMRALNFTNTDVNGSWFNLASQGFNLNQEPYYANSVFNFFPPSYVIPGTTINSPEFDIENTATVTLRETLANNIVNNGISSFTTSDLTTTGVLGAMAANPTTLVNYLNMLFMHSQMPTAMQTTIVSAITPLTSNAQRARVAVFLVITSPQYKIIH